MRLGEASFAKAPQKVDEVIKLLEYERETWSLLMKQVASEKRAPNAMAEEKPQGRETAADAAPSRSISVQA